jgi:hypothetical protein
LAAPDNAIIQIQNCVSIDLPYANGVFHPLLTEQIKKLSMKSSSPAIYRKYIKRPGPSRSIANHDSLDILLEQFQIQPVSINIRDVNSQIQAWSNCEIMLGILGSDIVNMALSDPKSVCAITPHWFSDIFFYGLASALGLGWNEYYGGDICEEKSPLHASSFSIDIDGFRRYLEYALGYK